MLLDILEQWHINDIVNLYFNWKFLNIIALTSKKYYDISLYLKNSIWNIITNKNNNIITNNKIKNNNRLYKFCYKIESYDDDLLEYCRNIILKK